MTKIRIDKPDKYIFDTSIDIRIDDINYGKHMSNDAMLRMAQEARVRFLLSMNYHEDDIEGIGIIVKDAALCYQLEVTYPTTLLWSLAINDVTRRSFSLTYSVINKATKKEVAILSTKIAFFDYKNRKITTVPNEFLKEINKLQVI